MFQVAGWLAGRTRRGDVRLIRGAIVWDMSMHEAAQLAAVLSLLVSRSFRDDSGMEPLSSESLDIRGS